MVLSGGRAPGNNKCPWRACTVMGLKFRLHVLWCSSCCEKQLSSACPSRPLRFLRGCGGLTKSILGGDRFCFVTWHVRRCNSVRVWDHLFPSALACYRMSSCEGDGESAGHQVRIPQISSQSCLKLPDPWLSYSTRGDLWNSSLRQLLE